MPRSKGTTAQGSGRRALVCDARVRMTASAYGVLGLADGAAPEAVRLAYKRVVLAAHPDRVRFAVSRTRAPTRSRGASPQGGTCEQFDKVQAAYATLSGAPRGARG